MLFCYELSLKLKRRRRAIIFPCNLSQTLFGDSSCHGRQHKIESSRRLPYCEYVSELERISQSLMMAVEVAFKTTNTIQTEGVRLHMVPATTERG